MDKPENIGLPRVKEATEIGDLSYVAFIDMSRPHDLPHPFFHLFSVNLLDICNAFSSKISKLNQGHLLLQCVLHNLDSSSSKQFIKARSSLDA
ncbi:protein bps1 [Quercus suber]|uniref:Protein bps1 n=1 Tax=Quercus suber TaxID=58331 RepID=A0AAW0M9V6_QUESU